jgi:predicted nuclease of predicted toxin-antitoxin system
MAYAKSHGLVVLTHDLDFGAILAATRAEGRLEIHLAVALAITTVLKMDRPTGRSRV